MKKILLVCIVMLGINQYAFSQNDKKWTIQMNPLLLFSDIFVDDIDDMLIITDIECQYKIDNFSNISLTLSFLYSERNTDDYYYDDDDRRIHTSYKENYFQIGIKPMYIFRPFQTGLKGFFLGAYPNIGFYYSPSENTFYTELGFGFTIGYKWVFSSGFTMQLGGGVGRTFSIPQRPYNESYINSDGRITLMHTDISIFDFKLGYSF
jgi:hypothetical protein